MGAGEKKKNLAPENIREGPLASGLLSWLTVGARALWGVGARALQGVGARALWGVGAKALRAEEDCGST